MSDSFSGYLADQLINYLANGTQFNTPPGSLWITVEDDTGTELSSSFPNARLEVTSTGWTVTDPSGAAYDSRFENANTLDFGKASSDVSNIQRFVVYDAQTGGNLLLSSVIDSAPFDVSSGTALTFEPGDASFDAIEWDEP